MLDPFEDISSLNDSQEKVISILPIFTAGLSCLGSGNIIYMVLSSWRAKQTPYRRILLGMSCCDLISSIAIPLQAFLLPASTSQRVWAIGNDASCTALGVFQQLSFTTVWYNGMLSCYFLMTVKFGIRSQVFARRYEPIMHILSIGYPLVTAIIGAVVGVFHELKVGQGCWVANYPKGCGCNELDTGICCTSPQIAWVFAGIPYLLAFVIILGNNLLVYCHVRSTIQKSLMLQSSSITDHPPTHFTTTNQQEHDNHHAPSSAEGFTTDNHKQNDNNHDHHHCRRPQQQRHHHHPRNDPQLQRIRAVATQAFLYVLAFLITYTPSMTLRVMESRNYDAEDEDKLFPLLVIQALLLPSAGFWNCFVYIRPAYLRARKDFPNETYWWSFRRALHGTNIHPTSHSASTNTAGSSSKRKERRGALRPEKVNNHTNSITSNQSQHHDLHPSGPIIITAADDSRHNDSTCSFAFASAASSSLSTTQQQPEQQQDSSSAAEEKGSSSICKAPKERSSSSSHSYSSKLLSSIRNSLEQEEYNNLNHRHHHHDSNHHHHHQHHQQKQHDQQHHDHHRDQQQPADNSHSSYTSATTATTIFTTPMDRTATTHEMMGEEEGDGAEDYCRRRQHHHQQDQEESDLAEEQQENGGTRLERNNLKFNEDDNDNDSDDSTKVDDKEEENDFDKSIDNYYDEKISLSFFQGVDKLNNREEEEDMYFM